MLSFHQLGLKVTISSTWIKSIISLTWITGVEGFTTEEDQELLSRIEKQIKRRFIIGSQVSEHAIIQDFTRQVKVRRNSKDFLIGLDL